MSNEKEVDLNAIARQIGFETGFDKIVVLVSKDQMIGLGSHGVESHKALNEVLTVGIHINLTQHDQMVLKGAAGEEAAANEARLRAERGEVVAHA